jgi:hypothetical protein
MFTGWKTWVKGLVGIKVGLGIIYAWIPDCIHQDRMNERQKGHDQND